MSSDSLWKSCKTCGKKIAADAKSCPQCGSKNSRNGWAKWAAGGFVSLMVIGGILKDGGKGSHNATGAVEPDPQAAIATTQVSAPTSSAPKIQKAFVEALERYSSQFSVAKNELQESSMRDDRRATILSALSGGLRVENWVGSISSLETNTEGKAILTVRVSPNIVLKTWNNALSDIIDNTLIEKNSRTYNSLLNMSVGDSVVFSGSFLASDEDGIKETSMTISGSMQEPEFLFKFQNVEKQ